jgi:uncharacterized membrane protein YeaQ/YmgE (transglycosylase-associated protein family)
VGILLWLLMGFIVGAVTGFLMKSSYPWYVDILLGIIGAAVGGWLSSMFLGVDLTGGFNLTSMVTSIIGAVIVVAVVRAVLGRRSTL